MLCPICESNNIKLLYSSNINPTQIGDYLISENITGKCHNVWQCQACQHGFINDQEFIKQVTKSYPDQPIDDLYVSEHLGRRKTAQKYLVKIEKIYPQKGILLDIGCYTGLFLDEAQKRGWQAEGIEASAKAVQFARQNYGLNRLRQGKIEQVINGLPNQTYDLISMFDVIEHLKDPSLVIRNIYEKIKPNGLLLISTPDIGSINAKISQRSWYSILPSHIHYFSKNSLLSLLKQCTFNLVFQAHQTRYFSLSYGFSRNQFSFKLGLNKIFDSRLFKKILFPLNLRDQLLIIARKKQS